MYKTPYRVLRTPYYDYYGRSDGVPLLARVVAGFTAIRDCGNAAIVVAVAGVLENY